MYKLIVVCMVATLALNSCAAAGNAGTNMCMAKVPLKVMSTSNQRGGCSNGTADTGGLFKRWPLMLRRL
jgi:hypothetical protein